MPDIEALLGDFDRRIVERGEAYFQEGRVHSLEETEPGRFEATVRGSEDYGVAVSLPEDGEPFFDCDCPYWDAPYCKHVAAVLTAIRQRPRIIPARAQGPGKKDPLSADALGGLSQAQLISLIRGVAERCPDAREWLCARLMPPENALDAYRKMIRKGLRGCADRDYVSERELRAALWGAEEALGYLGGLIDGPQVDKALEFFLMLAGETEALAGMNCNAAFGFIERCFARLDEIVRERAPAAGEETGRRVLQRLTEAAASPSPWTDRFIHACVRLADALPELRGEVLALCLRAAERVEAAADDSVHSFECEQAQAACFALILRWEGEEAAARYAERYPNNEDFRARRFETLCAKGEYGRAKALCEESEALYAEYPGTQRVWQRRLYEACERMGDKEACKAVGERLLLGGDEDSYAKLKALYAEDAWPQKRTELLDRLERSYFERAVYLSIIKREGDKARLWAFVSKHPAAVLALYGELLPEYADDVHALFLSVLRRSAAYASSRGEYQQLCGHIAAYADAFGWEEGSALVEELQNAYPRRRAMQEELRAIAFSAPRSK